MLVLVETFDQFKQHLLSIQCHVINLYSLSSSQPYAHWVHKGFLMQVHFMLIYSRRSIVVVHIRTVNMNDKIFYVLLVCW